MLTIPWVSLKFYCSTGCHFYVSSLIENLIDEAVWLFVIVTLIGFFFLVFSEANLIPVLVISYNGGL